MIHQIAGGDVPDFDRGVHGAGQHPASVGAPAEICQLTVVPRERTDNFPGNNVNDLEAEILETHCHQPAFPMQLRLNQGLRQFDRG